MKLENVNLFFEACAIKRRSEPLVDEGVEVIFCHGENDGYAENVGFIDRETVNSLKNLFRDDF
jgi:hypothetical protein